MKSNLDVQKEIDLLQLLMVREEERRLVEVEVGRMKRLEQAEPLVDSGMIQVAVAIAVIGFVFQGFNDRLSSISVSTYLLSGTGCLMLYSVYIVQWQWRLLRGGHRSVMPNRVRILDNMFGPLDVVGNEVKVIRRMLLGVRWLFTIVYLAHSLVISSFAMTLIELWRVGFK